MATMASNLINNGIRNNYSVIKSFSKSKLNYEA
jgi:hypothetical protein